MGVKKKSAYGPKKLKQKITVSTVCSLLSKRVCAITELHFPWFLDSFAVIIITLGLEAKIKDQLILLLCNVASERVDLVDFWMDIISTDEYNDIGKLAISKFLLFPATYL